MQLKDNKTLEILFNQKIKNQPLYKVFKGTLRSLPTPINLSLFWNFGSLLGLCLIIQILTGLILATSYSANIITSFYVIFKTIENIDFSWFYRYIHANGASFFFVCLFIHIGRGVYFNSFLIKHTWSVGVSILLLTIAAAFLGYVLPINQISFWGARVITNLFTEIPYVGTTLVKFIWGDVSVENPTITRFFTFHFLIPFIILALVVLHILFLHSTGSSNPLGLYRINKKVIFKYNYSLGDLTGYLVSFSLFIILCLYLPLTLGDDENFIQSNPGVTPQHIQPEWYFLFAYAILRSIPNKLGGVIALALSVIIFYILPFTHIGSKKNLSLYPLNKINYWFFVVSVILLTWIGINSVEPPYILTGQILTFIYFFYFFINPLIIKLWDFLYK